MTETTNDKLIEEVEVVKATIEDVPISTDSPKLLKVYEEEGFPDRFYSPTVFEDV
jgi:hypothetical protein